MEATRRQTELDYLLLRQQEDANDLLAAQKQLEAEMEQPLVKQRVTYLKFMLKGRVEDIERLKNLNDQEHEQEYRLTFMQRVFADHCTSSMSMAG